MISNRDLVEKTKPILKDSYFQVFICIVLASILPQIISSVSPQNLYLNIGVVWLSGYIQLGIAVFCLDVFKKGEGEFTTIFSRFNSLKPIFFITVLSIIILLGFILLIIPGIILAFVLYTLSQGFNNIVGIELLGYEKSPISTAMFAILLGMIFGNIFQIREIFLKGLED